jgi:hypothetical protein
LWTWVRPRARFINLGEKIGGFLDQGRRKPRVACGSRELKKRRGLTHEILPANHDISPLDYAAQNSKVGISFRPNCTKVDLINWCAENQKGPLVKFERDPVATGRPLPGHQLARVQGEEKGRRGSPLSQLVRSGRGEADPVPDSVAAAASNRKSLKPKLKPNRRRRRRSHTSKLRRARCFGTPAPRD